MNTILKQLAKTFLYEHGEIIGVALVQADN